LSEAAGRSGTEAAGPAAEPEVFPEAMKVIGILREREAGEALELVKAGGENLGVPQ